MTTNNLVYQSKTQLEHILTRPEIYIGTTAPIKENTLIYNNETIFSQELSLSQGLIRLFIEALSNAADNIVRSREHNIKASYIKINITQNSIEVINDGLWIPVVKNEQGQYIPELIFSSLFSSSNYNDEEERLTSGLNGLGIKLANIFSESFQVEVVDPEHKLKFTQEWTKNSQETILQKVVKSQLKTGRTQVKFKPDLHRFGVKSIDTSYIAAMQKLALDIAFIYDIKVIFNDQPFKCGKLQKYTRLFNDDSDNNNSSNDAEKVFAEWKSASSSKVRFEVCITPFLESIGRTQVSFVNGIFTAEGGAHVASIQEAILRPLASKYKINFKDLKKKLTLFIVATLPSPSFTTQSKHKLASPSINIDESVFKRAIAAISKWPLISELKSQLKDEDLNDVKKLEKTRAKFKAIKGYDPANKKGVNSTLILCEGLSAKTFCCEAIKYEFEGRKGRDYFGILPLQGVILNARNATGKKISENKEVQNLLYVLKLQVGLDYTKDEHFKKLNYGRIMILCDADSFGDKISALVINLFHYLYPSLLRRKDFLLRMNTPILRVFKAKSQPSVDFYNLHEADKYLRDNPKAKVKYYKGLGSSSREEIKTCYSKCYNYYSWDTEADINLTKVFHKDCVSQRKSWLLSYNSEQQLDITQREIGISEVLNKQTVQFSLYDNHISIPSVVDGLKPSQRKIIYATDLKKLKYSGSTIKIAQLAAYTAEKTNYLHGETSLQDNITKLTHSFTGSNNLPYLFTDSQTGSRLALGKDAASCRYTFCKQASIFSYLFKEDDFGLLEREILDGDIVEPTYYVPVIPMLLVNGAKGIGTGFSTDIPSYNPLDVIENCRRFLGGQDLEEMIPFYKNFKGGIESVSAKTKYICKGVYTMDRNTIKITEIPVNIAIDSYKEHLEELLEKGKIIDLKNNSESDRVNFEIKIKDDNSFDVSMLNLSSSINLSNLVCIGIDKRVKKLNSVLEVIEIHAKVRLELYEQRKRSIITSLENKLVELKNIAQFVEAVIAKRVDLFESEDVLIDWLESQGYSKLPLQQKQSEEGNFNYLINIPARKLNNSFLAAQQQLIVQLEEKLEQARKKDIKDMWLEELEELEEALADEGY